MKSSVLLVCLVVIMSGYKRKWEVASMGADLCQAWVHILCQAGAVSKPKATSRYFKDYLKPAKVGRNFPMLITFSALMCSLKQPA